MSRGWRVAFLVLFLCSPSLLLAKLSVPEKPAGYVTDTASLLSSSARQNLEILLETFEKETSNQIEVAIFPSLEGEVLEDFSIRLAEKWKIGQAGKDNGVIFLIFPNDRKMRIEVGYGLEGVLPDALAGSIIRDVVAPHFKASNFDGGVTAGVQAIIQATKGEFAGIPQKARLVPMKIWLAGLLLSAFAGFFFPAGLVMLIIYFCLIMVVKAAEDGVLVTLQFLSVGVTPIITYMASGRPLFDSKTLGSARTRRGETGLFTSFGGGSGGSSGGWSGGGGGSFGGGGSSGGW